MLATRSTDSSIWINKTDVARFFGVSKKIIDRWVKAGKLPKPKRWFGLPRWDYREIARLRKFGNTTEPPVSTDYPPSPASVSLTWRGSTV